MSRTAVSSINIANTGYIDRPKIIIEEKNMTYTTKASELINMFSQKVFELSN